MEGDAGWLWPMLNELSLFSGYGGFTLGLRLAGVPIRTVGYVEIEPYCQEIIKARIKDGLLDDAPIWPDIRAFDGRQCRGLVDLITAGFPCQPHSFAGQRLGEKDPRNLWPDTFRVISEVGPTYVLLENVPGILTNGYAGTVIGQLSELGYGCRWGLVSAAAVGAPHLRWRWWCLAHTQSQRTRLLSTRPGTTRDELHCQGWQRVGNQPDNSSEAMAHSHCNGREEPGNTGISTGQANPATNTGADVGWNGDK